MDLTWMVEASVSWAFGGRCAGCGVRASPALCGACEATLRATAGTTDAAFRDEGVAARLVRIGKAGRWRGAGTLLASVVASRIRSGELRLGRVDLVTWVPADGRRRAERGGHLPERVARALAGELGVPASGLLERRRGRPQRGLDRRARARNVAGAFVARRGAPDCRGLRLLMVDDVRTTGATFDAARAPLEVAGARVTVLAVVGVAPPRRRYGHAGNVAGSAEIVLTSHVGRADGVWQVERKADDQ